MGYMRHHAIVVTSWDPDLLNQAQALAKAIFKDQVSDIVGPMINNNSSFFVAPDGSKEGWDYSDQGDENRDQFIKWLDEQRYEDGSTSLDWIEVQFGDDELETKILRDSDELLRMKYTVVND